VSLGTNLIGPLQTLAFTHPSSWRCFYRHTGVDMVLETLVCLATAIYFEARGEPFAGQLAVANTIMNRVEDERFPDTVCDVVTQGPTYSWTEDFPVRHKCQFSFYCDGRSDEPTDAHAYEVAELIAKAVLEHRANDVSEGATHYHATYVNPSWSETKEQTVRINNHIFYRWRDTADTLRKIERRKNGIYTEYWD